MLLPHVWSENKVGVCEVELEFIHSYVSLGQRTEGVILLRPSQQPAQVCQAFPRRWQREPEEVSDCGHADEPLQSGIIVMRK